MDLNNIESLFSMYGILSLITVSYFSIITVIILLILEIPYVKIVYLTILTIVEMYLIMMLTIYFNTNSKIDNEEIFKINTISNIINNIEPEKNIDYMILNTEDYYFKEKYVLLSKYKDKKGAKEILETINNSLKDNVITEMEKNNIYYKISQLDLNNLENFPK